MSDDTLGRALLLLAGRCDGAQAADGAGFNASDTNFGHALAERVDAGLALSFRQARAAHRMLRKYRRQLAGLGVDYDAIPEPAEPADDAATAQRVAAASARRSSDDVVLTVVDGRIRTKTPFRLKDVVKSIPNRRWDATNKLWTYPASPTQAKAVRDALRGHTLVTDAAFEALLAEAEGAVAAQVHRGAEDLPDVPVCNLPAWKHQRQAFWFAREQSGAMLAMDMGTGKSRVTVDLLQNFNEAGARRVLIVCPPKVLGVWPREFRKHAAPGREWHVVNGTYEKRGGGRGVLGVAERVREFEHALYDCRCGKPHAVVVNYEATGHEPLKGWKPKGLDYVVFDEVHKIKAPNGVWSRWCMRVGKLAERRLGLTGTPMPQSPLDVFAQYRAIEPAIYGSAYTTFKRRYAIMGGYENHEVLGLQNEAELSEKFHSIAYTVGAEVLDLPDEVPDVTLACTLGREARKIYDQVAGDMWASWEAGEITAANVLVKLLRLQQITGGAATTDEGEVVEIDRSKADLLRDVLDDVGRVDKEDPTSAFEPAVVFCRFIHDLDVVRREAESLGRRYREVSGRRNDGLTADSTMAEDCDVVGVQIQSGGTGVDLTRSCYAVYYSVGYSLADYLQSRARLARPGQTRSVRFLHLVATDTQDEEVYEALAAREEVVDYVMGLGRDGGGADRPRPAVMDAAMAELGIAPGDLAEGALADALGFAGF